MNRSDEGGEDNNASVAMVMMKEKYYQRELSISNERDTIEA